MALSGLLLISGCGESSHDSRVPQQVSPPSGPKVPMYSIWRPFFFTDVGDQPTGQIIGTAFALTTGDRDQAVVVTSLDLLGPQGGLQAAIEPDQIHKQVRSVVITEAFGVSDNAMPIGVPLHLDPARSGDLTWEELAMVVLPPGKSGKRLSPLRLADSPPEAGQTVWLATAVFGGAPASQCTHEAVVTAIDDTGRLRYQFGNERLNLHAAAGAPMLNRQGAVVAMHQSDSSAGTTVEGTGIVAAAVRSALQVLLSPETNTTP